MLSVIENNKKWKMWTIPLLILSDRICPSERNYFFVDILMTERAIKIKYIYKERVIIKCN